MSQRSSALRAELDEERRKYQGLLREFTRLEQRYDNLREMSQLAEVPPTSHLTHRHADEPPCLTSLLTPHPPQPASQGHRRTDSAQSLNLEPLSPQSLTPLTLSPFPSAVPSPEERRRISVTSPPPDRKLLAWRNEGAMVRRLTRRTNQFIPVPA